ncbi:MAG: sigma-70 family RNA polymerase sigma factor [Verrucomicrobiota bacterium]
MSATPHSINWEESLRSEEAGLRRLIGSRLGHSASVDDVMQEVAIAALTGSARPTDPNHAPAWLRSVAVNKIRDFWRSRQRKEKLENAVEKETNAADDHSPFEWVVERERTEIVQAALAALKAEDRELLRLKYFENQTYEQIAVYLGLTVKALEYRLQRARTRLRDNIQKLHEI